MKVISSRRKLELEKFLEENISIFNSCEEGHDVFKMDVSDRIYITTAKIMPYKTVKNYIEYRDNNYPYVDELMLIRELAFMCFVSENTIIKRINEVRNLIKYEEKVKNMGYKRIKK